MRNVPSRGLDLAELLMLIHPRQISPHRIEDGPWRLIQWQGELLDALGQRVLHWLEGEESGGELIHLLADVDMLAASNFVLNTKNFIRIATLIRSFN